MPFFTVTDVPRLHLIAGGGLYGTQTCFPLPDVERVNNPNISKTP